MPESFFLDASGTATTITHEPALGRVEHVCAACGRSWDMTRGECACGSHELLSRVTEPTLIERVGGAIRAVVVPAKKPSPRASAAQVDSLRALQAAVSQLLTDLHALDAELVAAVRGDVEELIPAQGHIHSALSISGDRSVQRLPGLSLGLETLRDVLDITIKTHEDNPK